MTFQPTFRTVSTLLSRAQRRFRAARPGSVLILVVALLVLIALAGTAMITTARNDRYATVQTTTNTEVDLLMDGLARMVKATVVGDLFAQTGYRDPNEADPQPPDRTPLTLSTFANGHSYADSPIVDSWLASRSPDTATGTDIYWPAVSGPLVGGTFESPIPLQGGNANPAGRAYLDASGLKRFQTKISSVTVQSQSTGRRATYPALIGYDGTTEVMLIAADADGDGIADSGLWRLPVGERKGDVYSDLTFYAGIRIIDNASAANLAVHWKPNTEYLGAEPQLPANLFPCNFGLQQLLFDDTSKPERTALGQMNFLNNLRFDKPAGAPAVNDYASSSFVPNPIVEQPNSWPPVGRADFDWISPYDQFHHQLGRRVDVPDYFNVVWPGESVPRRFRAISAADGKAFAYRFLFNPTNPPTPPTSPNANVQSAEEALFPSVNKLNVTLAHNNTPYNPGDYQQWYRDNFNYSLISPGPAPFAQTVFSRRALLVTRSPVSALATQHRELWAQAVAAALPGGITTSADSRVNLSKMVLDLTPAGGTATPEPKVAANTATFGELWRAYAQVMSRPDVQVVSGTPKLLVPVDSELRQFRSPLRIPEGAAAPFTLPPEQMVLLRAAIAAVNAEDIRDSDDDVTSHKIRLRSSAGNLIEVTVYGTEKQPFITEVFFNNDNSVPAPAQPGPGPGPVQPPDPEDQLQNPHGYVAIELHNPYPEPLSLKGYRLAVLTRRKDGDTYDYPNMNLVPITGAHLVLGDSAPTIPPGGYIVLHNYKPQGQPPIGGPEARDDTTIARRLPLAVRGRIANGYYVPNLHEVMHRPGANTVPGDNVPHPGGELVLLRPHRADGFAMADNRTPSEFAEVQGNPGGGQQTTTQVGNLVDYVPCDSYDFSQFNEGNPGAGPYIQAHYVRKRIGTNNSWNFVYPGRWRALPTANDTEHVRQQGTSVHPWNPQNQELEPWANGIADSGARIRLGAADPQSSYLNSFRGIQLNNNFNVNKLAGTKQHYPFGGFARDGDLLEVPFIGAYRIRTDPNSTGNQPVLLELNSVTVDSSYADDLDTPSAPSEVQSNPKATGVGAPGPQQPVAGKNDALELIGRFCPLEAIEGPQRSLATPDTYSWARDLFDYLTVETPAEDFSPNAMPNWVDPARAQAEANAAGRAYYSNPGSGYPYTPPFENPYPARNTGSTPNAGRENLVPREGLINVCTAPLPVLASIPFTDQPDKNLQIARQIIILRDGIIGRPVAANGGGPRICFTSVFDLNQVQQFRSLMTTFNPDADSPNRNQGDLTEEGIASLSADFEARFLALTRVSNMLTNRSDGFTCYLVLQGWRNAGTPDAELAVQKRLAFMIDRSRVTPANRDLTPDLIPTD